ncbi:hypothetical protein SAMN05216311_102512 [Chitinophaga sp. CF418]|nr:hypothetical protein SAMN05216311_102512 [Chitinophaga sp. CF418]
MHPDLGSYLRSSLSSTPASDPESPELSEDSKCESPFKSRIHSINAICHNFDILTFTVSIVSFSGTPRKNNTSVLAYLCRCFHWDHPLAVSQKHRQAGTIPIHRTTTTWQVSIYIFLFANRLVTTAIFIFPPLLHNNRP